MYRNVNIIPNSSLAPIKWLFPPKNSDIEYSTFFFLTSQQVLKSMT